MFLVEMLGDIGGLAELALDPEGSDAMFDTGASQAQAIRSYVEARKPAAVAR